MNEFQRVGDGRTRFFTIDRISDIGKFEDAVRKHFDDITELTMCELAGGGLVGTFTIGGSYCKEDSKTAGRLGEFPYLVYTGDVCAETPTEKEAYEKAVEHSKNLYGFNTLVRPLMDYLCKNWHPHVAVIVTPTRAELMSGEAYVYTEEYLVD